MFKFKSGDEVIVLKGRDKGKKGTVEKVLIKDKKIVISGVNIYKRHRKATRTQGAGIYEVTRPVDVAAVAIICPKCTKPTRVGFNSEGKSKHRICKKCKGIITVKRSEK